MTTEQKKISVINHKKAWTYFLMHGQIPLICNKWEYDLHHINPDWKENDIERYIQWNPEDLIVLTHAEHTKLHMEGRVVSEETKEKMSKAFTGRVYSEEHNRKLSEAMKGKLVGEKNGMFGKGHSEDVKNKISEANKGKPAWNKGKHYSSQRLQQMSEVMKGKLAGEKNPMFGKSATKGKHYYNNGVIQVVAFECPEGFKKGRLRK